MDRKCSRHQNIPAHKRRQSIFAAMLRYLLALFFSIFIAAGNAKPAPQISFYGYRIDTAATALQLKTVSNPHHRTDPTADFYLLLLLCLILGAIRFSDPHYFGVLLRSFRNPSGSRHFKEQIQSAAVSNFLMNLFFGIVAGAYIYYAGRLLDVGPRNTYESKSMLLLLVGGMLLIYLVKYFVIRFSGWAFRVEAITEQYLFNVFLINKVIGIVLLPFTILLAFAAPQWVEPVAIVSLIAVALLLINRYTRSWAVFGSFFQYSRFHFFTYLCASEILPMAILVKMLLRTLA